MFLFDILMTFMKQEVKTTLDMIKIFDKAKVAKIL